MEKIHKPRKGTKQYMLKQLNAFFWRAIEKDKWQSALQALELEAKIIGMIKKQIIPEVVPYEEMTQDQLQEILQAMEKFYPELKDCENTSEEEPVNKKPNGYHPPPYSVHE